MKRIVVATKNKGKVREFQDLFQEKGYKVVSLLDLINAPDIEETGTTFKQNAILKAEGISSIINELVIADDSGLSIDYLGGKPGVYSARYAGEEKDDNKNVEKVLHEMVGVPAEERTARFHCALALAIPNQPTVVVEGTCEGRITEEAKGSNGFGYDPIFFVEEQQKTMAQLTKEEKNKISHRANALALLEKEIHSLDIL
ncbi:XTP/dITP diphosphatase [Bacillus pinisoli]|uniref:XTP/dITP diphosphatase n=1 Tax=Bacillus pinisoli TaxID=2901866 RepID=UPI001FF237B9